MPGINHKSLSFTISRAAEKAAVDYCSHLFSLCFLHLKDSGLVKYMLKNVEFISKTVNNDKVQLINANLQTEMKKVLHRRVVLGIDANCAKSTESMAIIKQNIENVFGRLQ